MTGPRGLLLALALLAAAALLLLTAGGGEPVARGAGLFCLAAVGGVLATRRIGRRLVGVGTVAVGGLAVWLATGVAARAGGVLAVIAGGLVTVRGPAWSALSARYGAAASPGAGRGSESGAGHDGTGGAAPSRPHDLWDALDRGEDPTVER